MLVNITEVPATAVIVQSYPTLLPPCMVQMPAELGVTVTLPCLSTAEPEITVLQAPNVALTVEFPLIEEMTQVPVPEHPEPDQPVNGPLEAEAVSVTDVPAAKLPVQALPLPQLMPPDELVTVPAPAPNLVTVTE